MKKFTLIVCAAMMAAASFAQPVKQNAPSILNGMKQLRTQRQMARPSKAETRQQDMRTARMMKSPLKAEELPEAIVDQPEGKVYEHAILTVNGLFYNWMYGWMSSATDAGDVSIVEGTDGNVYVKGILSSMAVDEVYWLKAEPQGDDLYTIKMQPCGAYWDYQGGEHTYYIARMEYYMDEESGYDDYNITDNTTVTVWYKDGVMKTIDEMNPEAGYVASAAYGPIYWHEAEEDDDYESGWYNDNQFYWSLSTAPLTETYFEPSENATIEQLVMKYKQVDTFYSKTVNVAFEGNDVYLKLYTSVPGWVKGTIEGNKIKVANQQYAGVDSYYGRHTWIHTASVATKYYEDTENPDDSYYYDYGTIVDGIEFDYDAENMVMSTEQAIYFDGARERIYYADYFNALTIYRFVEVPAVPTDPSITNFWNYDDYFGNAELDFTLNATDVDGNYITPDKLSYVVYVDDELFEADAEEYGMEESMSEFPYGFRDPEGYIGSNYFCVFFAPAKNMGLQAIYRGAGEENRSNIVMYDIESGQVNIIENAGTGIEAISQKNVTSRCEMYDLQGRRVNGNARGIVIQRMMQADGTMKAVKTIRK